MGNQEWTIQSYRQHLAHDIERRQTKQKTQKTEKMSNTDHAKKPGVNPGACEG